MERPLLSRIARRFRAKCSLGSTSGDAAGLRPVGPEQFGLTCRGGLRAADQFYELVVGRGHALSGPLPLPWLTTRGHAAIEANLPADVRTSLVRIFALLDGNEDALRRKATRSVAPDFLLHTTEVEFDEDQHFTIQRLATFALYPSQARLGFDVAHYAKVCLALSKQAERAFAHKTAVEFPGPAGRARQRAYFDAFRDLVAPVFGNGPVIRIAAPDRDADAAVPQFERQLTRVA